MIVQALPFFASTKFSHTVQGESIVTGTKVEIGVCMFTCSQFCSSLTQNFSRVKLLLSVRSEG